MWKYLLGLWALLRAYQGIRFFLIRRRVRGPVSIMPASEPFFIRKKGNKVVLLVHGFTSSPGEFRRLGNFLARKNLSVYAPLLPGHGTSPERLSLIKYFEWVEFLEMEIKMLEKYYSEIYLVGNSFGGNLALILAEKSIKIKGVCLKM